MTVLFCDITGSTSLGESTDPEALRAILARYFERMKGIIESHGGTVEKFIGDAVMAVFGVPVLHEDDAPRACRAALEMQAALPEIGVLARIGINSGEVVTGTAERLATGDAVNVAARLEQAAQPGEVLIGEETLRLAGSAVAVETVDPLDLKGKSERVPAYRLLAVPRTVERSHSLAPMVGRERELHRLQDAFAQAIDDRSCQLFTVLGTAGVGKSRLSLEFLHGLDGARVVRGRCLSYGEGITYWPVIEVMSQLDARPADEYAASAMKSLLGATHSSASADEIAWAFRKLLEEQARAQPLVVVFDDIQWGEEIFLDLVEHVADLARDAPFLLLCMARPELLEKRPGWGGGKWNATTVLLEPLGARDTDQLLDALGGVNDAMRERIGQAAEGNPLFVEEMVALLRASGENEVVVPPTIQALLAARLDQLDPGERSVLEVGAVEGRVFHRSAVTALLDEDANLPGRLVALVRKELVRPAAAQLSSDEAYRFRHLLIRDAAYDSLPKAVRAELHERFVRWLEERGADLPELDEIAGYHLEQAVLYKQELGRPDAELAERAAKRLATAGRRAMWRGDRAGAKRLIERTLALLRPVRLEVDLELDLALLQPTMGERAAMVHAIAGRAQAAGDRRGELVAGVVAAHRRTMANAEPIDDMDRLSRETLPFLEGIGDHAGLVHIWIALADVANTYCRFEDEAHASEMVMYHGRHIGRHGLHRLAHALVLGPRPADEALQALAPHVADDPHPNSRAWLAMLLHMLGRVDEARAMVEEASRTMREVADEYEAARMLALFAMSVGDHATAVLNWRIVCDTVEKQGNRMVLSTFAPALGHSLCMLGRYDEAELQAQRGRELGDQQDAITQILWRRVQALVLAHRGQHDEAERLAREAITIAQDTDALNWHADSLCDLATVLDGAGRKEEAAVVLGRAIEQYQRKQNLMMVARVRERLGVNADSARVGPAYPA